VTGKLVDVALNRVLGDIRTGQVDTLRFDPIAAGFDHVQEILADPEALDVTIEQEAVDAETSFAPTADEGPPSLLAEDPGPPQPQIFWNSWFPEDRSVNATKVLVKGTRYRFRTALEPETHEGAAATSPVTVDLQEGEPVEFVSLGTGLWLHDPASTRKAEMLHSDALAWRVGEGTPAFEFDLTPFKAGEVLLELRLVIRNAVPIRQTLHFQAYDSQAAAGAVEKMPGSRVVLPDSPRVSSVDQYPAADLQIEVREAGEALTLYASAPGHSDAKGAPTESSSDDLIRRIFDTRAKLKELVDSYAPRLNGEPLAAAPSEALLQVARLGASLHEALFGTPDDDRSFTEQRRNRAKQIAALGRGTMPGPRVTIVSTNYPIPWALLYDARFNTGADARAPGPAEITEVDVESFWGYRFRLDRSSEDCNDLDFEAKIGRRVRSCLNPHLDIAGLSVVDAQRRAFSSFQGLEILPPIESVAALETWLRQADKPPACDLLYFFCHARPAIDLDRTGLRRMPESDAQAALVLDDSQSRGGVSVEQIMKCWGRRLLPDRPLVLMNACASGQGTESGFSPFVKLFLNSWRARGFVGTDAEIPTAFADVFARRLIERFLQARAPIGDALHETVREALAAGNPLGLLYCLYGRPDLAMTHG
jgi:CHAT domain